MNRFKANTFFKTFTKKVDPFGGMHLPVPPVNAARLSNKTAIITGAYQGIGRESALLFAKSGVSGLTISDINPAGSQLAEEINEIRKAKICSFVQGNVAVKADNERLVEKAISTYGQLNILFNNAGIMDLNDGTPFDTTDEIWDRTFAINVKGTFDLTKVALPHLLKSKNGSIINVASFVALMGAATPQIAYTASKGAVLAMTRELAIIYAKDGLRFNSICPGPLRTKLLMDFLNDEEKKARRIVHLPNGRFGEAIEIAQAACFLASDESSYINGTTFSVDGGLTQAYVTA